MVEITCIKKDNGNHENQHTAITILGWVDVNSGERGRCTRLDMYDFIKNKGGQAYVIDRLGNKAFLITAVTTLGTRYVKTIADSTKTDNLLSLPECIG
jgi:hypothetical protein